MCTECSVRLGGHGGQRTESGIQRENENGHDCGADEDRISHNNVCAERVSGRWSKARPHDDNPLLLLLLLLLL